MTMTKPRHKLGTHPAPLRVHELVRRYQMTTGRTLPLFPKATRRHAI